MPVTVQFAVAAESARAAGSALTLSLRDRAACRGTGAGAPAVLRRSARATQAPLYLGTALAVPHQTPMAGRAVSGSPVAW